MKVEVGKKYRMRGFPESEVVVFDTEMGRTSESFRVLAKTRKDKNDVWNLTTYTIGGLYIYKSTDDKDLVEVTPYDDFKINEPVMVSSNGFSWYRRHFAGVDNEGFPIVWDGGYTKWTGHGRTEPWPLCRKPTPEELGE